jgi:hypothetical protein
MTLRMTRNDLSPSLRASLLYRDGSIVNLVGTTAKFKMIQDGVTLVDKAAVVEDAVNGIVRYDWVTGDTDHSGPCLFQFIITFTGSKPQSFPPEGEKLVFEEPE